MMRKQSVISMALLVSLLFPAIALANPSNAIISVDDAKALHGKPNVVFVYGGSKEAYEANHIPGSYYAFPHDMQYLDDVKECDGLPMCKDRAAEFIGAMGIEAVAKQAESRILISDMGALGVEIAKNIVLAGCKELVIFEKVIPSSHSVSVNIASG